MVGASRYLKFLTSVDATVRFGVYEGLLAGLLVLLRIVVVPRPGPQRRRRRTPDHRGRGGHRRNQTIRLKQHLRFRRLVGYGLQALLFGQVLWRRLLGGLLGRWRRLVGDRKAT